MSSCDSGTLVDMVRASLEYLAVRAQDGSDAEYVDFEATDGEDGFAVDQHVNGALEALEVLGARVRSLECLEEAVQQMAEHQAGVDCATMAHMARRALYISRLGFQV